MSTPGGLCSARTTIVLLPPGSLTKMLTAMIAADWLPPGDPDPGERPGRQRLPRPGRDEGRPTLAARDTLHALLIVSANDAAYALAQRVGGSLAGFARIMRRRRRPARDVRPAGAPRSRPAWTAREGVDGGNRISAWDLAIAARDLMANPTLASIVA